MVSFWRQLRLVLVKNMRIKLRMKRQLLGEIFFPMFFFLILVMYQQILPPSSHDADSDQKTEHIHSDYPLQGFLQQGGVLAFAPADVADVQFIMERIRAHAIEASPRTGSKVMGLPSADAVDAYYVANQFKTADTGLMWAAVVFDVNGSAGIGDNARFSIRMNGSSLPDTSMQRSTFLWQMLDFDSEYLNSGFLTLQTLVNEALIQLRYEKAFGVPAAANVSLSSSFRQFPLRKYTTDSFHALVSNIGGLYFVIGFFPIVIRLMSLLVLEKEQRTREGMLMMGLSPVVWALGWYLTYSLITAVPCLLLSVLADLFNFMPATGPIPIFVLLYLYVQSLIMVSFAGSNFFDKSKTAGQLGAFLTFFMFVPYYAVRKSSSQFLLSALSLSSPVALTLGMNAINDAEQDRTGISFSGNLKGGPNTVFAYSSALTLLAMNVVWYAIIAWYLHNVIQGEFGVARHACFCLPRKRNGCNSNYASLEEVSLAEKRGQERADYNAELRANVEDVSHELQNKIRIRIRSLTKIYEKTGCLRRRSGSSKNTRSGNAPGNDGDVVALDAVDLDLYEGQIFALLGHNGAGKSTLVSVLSGLYAPTDGDVSIYGMDLSTELTSIRSILGVCPQHDILFDQLTVEEHLEFYAGIKGVPEYRLETIVAEKIREVGLTDKTHERISTLSGGQKRKLSVAIALIGDSKVIFLDEPTSGVDAYSRRQLWSVLQRYKKDRLIVLSTHFMDEAELLGDRIAILSKGRFKCIGSSLFLKSRFGIGYYLVMAKNMNKLRRVAQRVDSHDEKTIDAQYEDGDCVEFDETSVRELVLGSVPGAHILSSSGAEISFVMPLKEVGKFADLFAELETCKERLGISSYGISLTTLEEVFLTIAQEEEMIDRMSKDEVDNANNGSFRAPVLEHTLSLTEAKEIPVSYGQSSDSGNNDVASHAVYISHDSGVSVRYKTSFFRQFNAVANKRWAQLRRDKKSFFFQFFMPVLYVFVVLLASKNFTSSDSDHPKPLSLSDRQMYAGTRMPVIGVSSSTNLTLDAILAESTLDVLRNSGFTDSPSPYALDQKANPASEMIEWLLSSRSGTEFAALETSDFDSRVQRYGFTFLYNKSVTHTMPRMLNMIGSALLQQFNAGSKRYEMSAVNAPFPYTTSPSPFSGPGFLIAFIVGLALSYIPITYGVNLTKEKESKAKHQQFVMGLHPATYWFSNLFIDMVEYLIPVTVILILFVALSNDVLSGTNTIGAIVVLIMYGISVIPYTYMWSLMFDKATSAQTVMSSLYTITAIIMFFIALGADFSPNSTLSDILIPTFSFVHPVFGVMWGILTLARADQNRRNQASICAHSHCHVDGAMAVLEFHQLGRVVTAMAITAVLSLTITLLVDTGVFTRLCGRRKSTASPMVHTQGNDDDVEFEEQRVRELSSDDPSHPIQICQLRKVFPKSTVSPGAYSSTVSGASSELSGIANVNVAVNSLTLGVPRGECLGLLGPNGAGKSTTLNMMTGDQVPTSGNVFMDGHDIVTDISSVYAALGFCPQGDALLDLLTGREHLTMYARIKGIPESKVRGIVSHYISELQLDEHADKVVSKFSGGNKRKLSLAVALMGNPAIVLLDEPSTGMDPSARRQMWKVLTKEMPEKAMIITTHSMEEADALCSRIGIMVNGRLQCLGSSQHLKSKFGDGYKMEIRANVNAIDDEDDDESKHDLGTAASRVGASVDAIRAFVAELAPSSRIDEDFGGKLKFVFPRVGNDGTELRLSLLFRKIEDNKDRLGILDYSISQTTLEQVFIGFAKQQDEELIP